MRKLVASLALIALLVASFGIPGSAGAALGNPRTGYLTSPVTLPSDNSFADGPTEPITSATWVVSGSVYQEGGAECKLWDGVTEIASGSLPNTGTISLSGFITETASSTIKISCRGAGSVIDASIDFGFGNTGSYVTAVKVQ